jgi:GH35 family endo-1,4-beta-xylanase
MEERHRTTVKRTPWTLLPLITAIAVLVVVTIGKAAFAVEWWPLSNKAIERRINEHRTVLITLTVTDDTGKPASNTSVTVQMIHQKFLFGSNVFVLDQCGTQAMNDLYANRFTALLNYATLPFYWGNYEAKEGRTNEQRLRKMVEWCRQNRIDTKGHPLCWDIHQPQWLISKSPSDVESLLMGRIRRECAAFAGWINRWDVVNEAVDMPHGRVSKEGIPRLCQSLGQVELLKKCFAEARKAAPEAELLLNDYVTDDRYHKLIRDCLNAGVGIDAIGIQSHMHVGYRGAEWAWECCDRFARFGKPLHFTELTILSGSLKTDSDWWSYHPGWDSTPGGEKRQAAKVVEFYRVLFSHPAVEAITWWDFSDLNAWQGAPAGLLRKDMTPKPAYDALMKLIRSDWWTGPLRLQTDADGMVTFRGYLGTYTVTTDSGYADFEATKPGRKAQTVRIKPRKPNTTDPGDGK